MAQRLRDTKRLNANGILQYKNTKDFRKKKRRQRQDG